MAKINLTGMSVEALMNLRKQVDKRLAEVRTELEKQLAALSGQVPSKRKTGSSLRGRRLQPKYRSRAGETWAGRGAKPRWLVAALKRGKRMEDFLIDKSAKRKRRKARR
jgi:DNA-binding protein H-NS